MWIGLDIGSSFIKAAILDTQQRCLSHLVRAAFPQRLAGLPPGHFEVDPQAIVSAVRQVLQQIEWAAPRARGLLVCGQMGGTILVDQDGRPLTNYISWRDQRGAIQTAEESYPTLSRLREQLGKSLLQQLGNELGAGSALAALSWLAARVSLPHLATPLSISDFVLAQLCGSPARMHYTQALGTLHVENRDWHYTACEQLGLGGLVWPALQEYTEPLGQMNVGGHAVPVYPALGDHQCALAGTGLVEGELSLNISTGSQVSMLTPVAELGDYQTRPYIDQQYLNTITHLPAGRALEVLVQLLSGVGPQRAAPDEAWAHLLRAAEESPPTDLAVRLTFFSGPLGERGSIENISVENLTPGSLFRSALTSMAANYERCALRLDPQHGWSRVVLSGGLAQKMDLLRTMIAQRLTGPTRLSHVPEETLLGLLAVALVLEGAAPDVGAAGLVLRHS